MPYLNPGATVSPTLPAKAVSPTVAAVGPLPVHSHGRPGHRRSFSYTPSPSESTTGAFTPLASLPRRKPASFHLAVEEDDDDSSPEDNSPPKEPAPIATLPPQQQQQQPHKGHSGGRQSRSSSLSSPHAPPTTARFAGGPGLKPTPAGKPTNLNTDDEDDGRGLPPLKLRIPGLGGFGQAGSGANSPRGAASPRGSSSNLAGYAGNGIGSPVPFPKSVSPPRSRTSSNPVDVRITAATPSTAAAVSTSPAVGGTESPRPSFSRTASSPMILANGKPLKSSLKSSSSSPNIPFPSQSILPSRLYAEIANAQRQRERQQTNKEEPAGGLMPNQRHTRAASAPNLPNFDVSSVRPNRNHGAATFRQDSPPYDEDDEDEAETPGYEYMGAHTAPSTPSAPKAVHFPSTEEGGLTTVRVFKRTAKPVNLLLPGASGGEETETETDGEGYNSGPGANGAGYHYGIHNTWGFSTSNSPASGGGYQNPWDRYTRQSTAANTHANRGGGATGGQGNGAGAGGYPFPRVQIGGSGRMVVPTRHTGYQNHQHQGQHALPPYRQPSGSTVSTPKGQPAPPVAPVTVPASSSSSTSSATNASQAAAKKKTTKEKKRIVYELDSTSTSTVPKRDLAMFDNVFLESIDLQCSKTPPPEGTAVATDDSSEEDEESRVSPKLVCMLEGTLLVRNVAYEKHVSVRFTLDDWHTTSEVKAAYRESLGSLPDKWRSWVLGDRSSSTPSSPSTSSEDKIPAAPPAGSNPQWDRFSFSINLSDYARGRSLSSRTLWLVARYAVPGDVRVPIPKLLPGFNFSSPSNSLNPPLSGGGDDARWESELLRRCERDMVDVLVRGLGPSTPSSNMNQGQVLSVKQLVDLELRKRQIGVGAGMGREWWDNNASGNYRIGFREREVVTARPVPAPEPVAESAAKVEEGKQEQEAGQGEPGELGLPPLAQRRKNVLSCPPAFNNTPSPSIYGYSALSLPQISASTSTDSSSGDLSTHQRSASSGSQPSPAPSNKTSLPTSHSTGNLGSLATGALPNTSGRRAETTKAMAETTLERLKRLNLRNYAAPGMPMGHVRAASASATIGNVNANVSPPSTTPPVASPQALGVGASPLGSTLGVSVGRTSSNPLPLGTPPTVVLPEDRRNPQPSPLAAAHLEPAHESPAGIQTSHSQESTSSSTSSSSYHSKDSSLSEAGTNDSTPLTSPLHTPTMGAVDIPPAVRVRVGTGSEEASPNSEGGVAAVGNWRAEDRVSAAAASAAKVVKNASRDTAPTGEQLKTPTPAEDGILRPLLSRNSSVVPVLASIQPGGEHEESVGSETPTMASSGLSIPIPGREPPFAPRNNDLLSPLLEPMMSGGPTSFGALGTELGTSPPFSSLGDGSFGGRTLSSTSLNLNLLPDFGATDMGSSLVAPVPEKQTSTRGPIPLPLNLSGLNLKPKQIGILEGIREKSTSSPPRSPSASGSGSGRNSPAPLLLPRSFSNSSIPDAQGNVVVNRVEGITGTVKPPLSALTPASSLRDSTTASSLLDTPKASLSSAATLTPAAGRRVVSDGAARQTSPPTSGSESTGSSSKSGSGGSAGWQEGWIGAEEGRCPITSTSRRSWSCLSATSSWRNEESWFTLRPAAHVAFVNVSWRSGRYS
ncbi:hypothetical protein BKA70DRAFT_1423771 [Coprinopsis sp. MPI-PUGE-AT-0042]|nr:hypothetical protein BKA70DRAFT_1423771 [Coprinopsis sp. MPI-PUGE-AT-0042]